MASQKICVTSINYDSGRITTCVVSINEKNYTVKWANGKYEVTPGEEVVNCGDATKSGAGADANQGAKLGALGTDPSKVAVQPKVAVQSKVAVPASKASGAVPPAPILKPVVIQGPFNTHEELINQAMTDLKLMPV